MGGYERILVHLDSTDRCAERLALACRIAKRENGSLVGLFAETDPSVPGPTPDWPTARHRAAREKSQESFQAALQQNGVEGEWHAVDTGQPDALTQAVAAAARVADLTILGQYEEGRNPTIPAHMAEEVIVGAGRPVLVVPYAGHFSLDGGPAVVAWNGSREAAHALAGAKPLLVKAREVLVLEMLTEAMRPTRPEEPWTDPVTLLGRWGAKTHGERLAASGIGIMDLLLSRLTDEGAELLVMGAHGHYGFPHLGRGRGTRHILAHMTVPVLLAH